jgi:putative flippase GtrA
MNQILERLLSKKFIATTSAIISCSFLVYTDHIADGVYSAVMIATVSAYIAGNVIQKATNKTEVKTNE